MHLTTQNEISDKEQRHACLSLYFRVVTSHTWWIYLVFQSSDGDYQIPDGSLEKSVQETRNPEVRELANNWEPQTDYYILVGKVEVGYIVDVIIYTMLQEKETEYTWSNSSQIRHRNSSSFRLWENKSTILISIVFIFLVASFIISGQHQTFISNMYQ